MLGVLLVVAGTVALGIAALSQHHAPRPAAAAAGSTAPPPPTRVDAVPVVRGPVLLKSTPMAISIPAIGVQSSLQPLGLNGDGTIEAPPAGPHYDEAGWYEYSPTPGEVGPAIIEGHVDSATRGPSVFYRLGALKPGDAIEVTRADHTMAVFTVTGVRQYEKAAFPTEAVYGNTDFAALRLLTCGGKFDRSTHSYLANTVVFASLSSSR